MGLIQTVFGVLTLIAGGVSVLLVVNTKALRDSRDDLEKRVDQLEKERTRDKDAIVEKDTAIRFWRSAATGDEKLDALSELVVAISNLLGTHHADAQTNWVAVNAGLSHVGTSIDHMSDAVDELVDTLKEGDSDD